MPRGTPPHILILDPSNAYTRVLCQNLTKLNCKVSVENIARKAVYAAEEYRPDAILLDLGFWAPTGIQILEMLKNLAELKDTPIVVHTESATRSGILRAVRAGANSVIVKPASTESVVSKIHEVFERLGRADTFRQQVEMVRRETVDDETDAASAEVAVDAQAEQAGGDAVAVAAKPVTAGMDLEQLLDRAKEVKAMPHAIARTQKVSGDDDAGAADLAAVIESDPSISTMVLKHANSAKFGGQKRTASVKDAIVRIGFRDTRNLVLSLSVIENFGQTTNSIGFQRAAFWVHSLAVAALSEALARASKAVDPGVAYVCGLMHDVGKLIFDEHLTREYEAALEASGKEGISIADAERQVLQFSHADIGEALLHRWRFPEVITKVVMFHNKYGDIDEMDADYRPPVKLLHIANTLAKAMRFGHSGDEMLYTVPDELLRELQLAEGLPGGLAGDVGGRLEESRGFLGIPPDEPRRPRPEFEGKRLFILQDPKPIVDPYERYLSADWGFDIHRPDGGADHVENVDKAILVLHAADTAEDHAKYTKIFSDPFRGHLILLLEPSPEGENEAVKWPSDQVTVLRKPVDGRQLISTLAHVC